MGEAVASTQDRLSDFASQSHLSKTIYKFNTNWQVAARHDYECLFDQVDFSGAYLTTFIGFLCSYMLYTHINKNQAAKLVSYLFPGRKFNSKQMKSFCIILNSGMSISPASRLNHSDFYFRMLLKNNRDIFDLSNFNFLRFIERNSEILSRLRGLADLMEVGANSQFLQKILKEDTSFLKVVPDETAQSA